MIGQYIKTATQCLAVTTVTMGILIRENNKDLERRRELGKIK